MFYIFYEFHSILGCILSEWSSSLRNYPSADPKMIPRRKRIAIRSLFSPLMRGSSHTTVVTSKTKTKKIKKEPIEKTKQALTENEKMIVLFRQNNRCNVCAAGLMIHPCTKHKLFDFDHIIPRSKNGKTDLQNIQALCKMCHAVKTGWDMMK